MCQNHSLFIKFIFFSCLLLTLLIYCSKSIAIGAECDEYCMGDTGLPTDYRDTLRNFNTGMPLVFDWREDDLENFDEMLVKLSDNIIHYGTVASFWKSLSSDIIDPIHINKIKNTILSHKIALLKFVVLEDFKKFFTTCSSGSVYSLDGNVRIPNHKELRSLPRLILLIIGWSDKKRAWLCKNLSENIFIDKGKDCSFLWIHYNIHFRRPLLQSEVKILQSPI